MAATVLRPDHSSVTASSTFALQDQLGFDVGLVPPSLRRHLAGVHAAGRAGRAAGRPGGARAGLRRRVRGAAWRCTACCSRPAGTPASAGRRASLCLLGTYYAATDGVLMALGRRVPSPPLSAARGGAGRHVDQPGPGCCVVPCCSGLVWMPLCGVHDASVGLRGRWLFGGSPCSPRPFSWGVAVRRCAMPTSLVDPVPPPPNPDRTPTDPSRTRVCGRRGGCGTRYTARSRLRRVGRGHGRARTARRRERDTARQAHPRGSLFQNLVEGDLGGRTVAVAPLDDPNGTQRPPPALRCDRVRLRRGPEACASRVGAGFPAPSKVRDGLRLETSRVTPRGSPLDGPARAAPGSPPTAATARRRSSSPDTRTATRRLLDETRHLFDMSERDRPSPNLEDFTIPARRSSPFTRAGRQLLGGDLRTPTATGSSPP